MRLLFDGIIITVRTESKYRSRADGRLSAVIKRFAEIKLLMCRCSPDGVLIEKRLTFGFFGWIEKFLCNRYFPVGFVTSASGENDG